MKKITKKPFLYLDLDGTVRYSKSGHDFIQGFGDVAVFDDVAPKLMEYKQKGFMICGVTNQGGVAFGAKTEKTAWDEIAMMAKLTFPATSNSPWDYFATCFMHENGTIPEYANRSLCRKPDIGMLVEIEMYFAKKYIIPDYDESLFVGDREEDRLCAERAGIPFQWANEFFGRAQ